MRVKLIDNTAGCPKGKYPLGTEVDVELRHESSTEYKKYNIIGSLNDYSRLPYYVYREDFEILSEVDSGLNFAQIAMSK